MPAPSSWPLQNLQEWGSYSALTSAFLFHIACAFLLEPQYPFVALALWLFHRRSRSPSSFFTHSIFVFPLTYTCLDSLVPKLFQFTLSYHLPQNLPFKQLAELGGPFFLTFLLLLFQNGVFILASQVANRSFSPASFVKVTWKGLTVLVSAWSFGHWRLHTLRDTHSTQNLLHLAAIQSQIENVQKLAAEKGSVDAAQTVLKVLLRLSQEALEHVPKPDLLVWPETAFPTRWTAFKTPLDFFLQNQVKASLKNFSTPPIPLLFGGFEEDSGRWLNVAHLVQLDSPKPLQTYSKVHLFPWVEEWPFLSSFKFFQKKFPNLVPFSAGKPGIYFSLPSQTGSILLKPMICYDSLFPEIPSRLASPQAQLLLLITNDAWLGPWAAELHLNISSFRSVETRLPLVSVANTGISALVLPDGSITHASTYGKRKVLHFSVPLSPPLTLKRAFKQGARRYFFRKQFLTNSRF